MPVRPGTAMAAITIPSVGLLLPEFWEAVRDLDPEDFATAYAFPFLLELASLRDDEMLDEAEGEEPTIAASSKGMTAVPTKPWTETRVVSVQKRRSTTPAAHITVGRSAGNDIVVPSPLVSKLHAAFERRGDEWMVFDVGSRNGTTVSSTGIAPNEPRAVDIGTEIGFGDTRFLFVPPLFFHHAVTTLLGKLPQ